MKNLKIKILFFLLGVLTLGFSGCEDELEIEAADAFTEDFVFGDPVQAERLVFTAYNSTEGWGVNKQNWWGRRFNIEIGSFESRFNFRDLDQFRLIAGWNPANMGVLSNIWTEDWYYVREINIFLDKIDDSQAMMEDPDKVNLLKAEMRFLRANIYSKLIKNFGGVPILDRALGLGDEFDIPRNSYEECVDFIVSELDAVIPVLPETRPAAEFGRATSLAAMAVKSRTLLYAASMLHDPGTQPSGPLYDYSKGSKWQDAANAAKALIDAVGDRDLTPVSGIDEYRNLFLNSTNPDILFARPYGSLYDFGTDVNSLWNQTQAPSGYGGWSLSTPTHNFALEFNMADGTTTDGPSYDPTNPYENREMRFYANLNYNGSIFRGRDVQYFLSDDPETHPHGLDSPEGLGNVLHSSKTGYAIRKFQDESVGLTDPSAGRPFILYRLAEIYLNYAEAQYHLGDEATALQYLNRVSTRALQPLISTSGPDLLEAIKRERRIELSFEGHNFYDERRWMNVENLGFDVRGMRWRKAVDGTVNFEEYSILERPWFDRQYYMPIPQTEVEKAPALEQNAGY